MTTEHTDEAHDPAEDDELQVSRDCTPGVEPDEDTDDDPDTFPRAYVQELRAEAIKHRLRAKRATEGEQRLLAAETHRAAADVLADPTDLLTFTETAELLDDDGWPDPERIAAAAADLVARKPHLAVRRPRGDIGQGATQTTEAVNLAEIMRARA